MLDEFVLIPLALALMIIWGMGIAIIMFDCTGQANPVAVIATCVAITLVAILMIICGYSEWSVISSVEFTP